MLNWHLDFEAIHRLNFCLFLVPSREEPNIEVSKVRNSIEFIKDVSRRVISVIDNLDVDTNAKKILQKHDFIKVRNQFMETETDAIKIQEKIIGMLQLDDGTSECSNYHQSILDMGFISGILNSIARKLDVADLNKEKTGNFGSITDVLNTVKKRVNLISNRFKGSISHYSQRIVESIDELGKLGGEGVNKILGVFISSLYIS